MPNGTETKPTADIWSDPNLMSILLGMIGQSAMGEHQQGWQAQLGRAATMMGQSRKAALAAEEMKGEREEWRKTIMSLIRGGEPGPELEVPDVEGLGLSSTMLSAGMQPYAGTEVRPVEREKQPPTGVYGGGQLSLYDVLGQ